MVTVNTRVLKDRLSSFLHRAEDGERVVVLRDGKPVVALISIRDLPADDEQSRLVALEARGRVIMPQGKKGRPFKRRLVPARGKDASKMVIEDRR